ncbi:MAG: nucleoside-diphosphate kinase [Candidatus Paceibacterota bacterium]|jgi:nucleoside-diphosphate kinase
MEKHPKKERTLVIIKPDGIQRSLVGDIIGRLERVGLKFVAFKFVIPKEDQCWAHYNKNDAWFQIKGERQVNERKELGLKVEKSAIEYGKDILRANIDFFMSGPVLVILLEGNQAVGITKKLVGGTEPLTSDVGTIRGDLTLDSYSVAGIDGRAVRNLIHCSDSPIEAERESKIWLKDGDVIEYRLVQDQILYDVNLDGILE